MNKPIYVAYVDYVPTLTLQAHEICDELTSEEIVAMWSKLKKEYEELKKIVESKERM